MDSKKQENTIDSQTTDTGEENKQDLQMNRNKNERANENVKENSFEEDHSTNDVGSEITDGEAG